VIADKGSIFDIIYTTSYFGRNNFMSIDSEKDVLALKKIGRIVALAREKMIKAVKPGMTTKELDIIGEKILSQYGATSAPKCEYGFPGATCISVNDEVAHGIPGSKVIHEGDLINIDVSAELDGYFADTGASITVGPSTALKQNLCNCSMKALYKGLEKARAGSKINQIGRAIFNEARNNKFTVIKNLTGHGIGRRLHEHPHNIPNYYDCLANEILTDGLVLAVETFVSSKAEFVVDSDDGWTLRTPDSSLVAQFEHTIIVTKNEPIILTTV
jgi:methionyl aminopeptidase